ncbi:universal stress protein [Halalkalicoccus sp. NIPERK01]|uniref:universal stress protein n=1 Tax=Halalkalicoccus sp. NIPERK01 TaxID=3053469 RepID=UPI00256EE522|nr:universal stress protein [Halalkalicoccus sp. NIPERK01]MDL5360476.1 universal stress protein [Halalkalicoccus sp. NIPERK01]
MYRILIAVDDDVDRARAQARTIEEMPGTDGDAEVRLLHVFTENTAGASVGQIGSVRAAENLLSEAGVDVTLDETSGDPAQMILGYAAEHDVDLVCLGGRKRSPAGKALFGSVTQEVIFGTEKPVVVCGQKRVEG